MRIVNVHERTLGAPFERVGALLDGLSGRDDRLWPADRWPAMRLDGPLRPGAHGGRTVLRHSLEAA